MRRSWQLVSLVLVLVAALAAVGMGTGRAQEATPTADEMAMAMEGLSFTPLGWVDQVALPSPAYLEVARVSFAPGAGFPLDPTANSSAMVVVESGEITGTVVEQTWTITRGAALQQAVAMATPGAMPDISAVQEVVALGESATIQAGDVAYIGGNVSGEVRNNGTEEATALVFLIAPGGSMMGAMEEATPAP